VEEAWRQRRIENFRERFGITPEQEARLAPAMNEAVADLREVREQIRKRTGAIVGKNSAAVRKELTSEQQAKFDAWLKECQGRQATREKSRNGKEVLK
jgi:hypothetical protein